MKKILKITFILFFSLLGKINYAQVSAIPYYDHLNFNRSFFVIAETDARSNYYAVDLTQLNSTLAKAYFIDKAFKEPRLIRLDAGNENIVWFKVKKIYSDTEIDDLLLSLKNEAMAKTAAMTELEKEQWMKMNNK